MPTRATPPEPGETPPEPVEGSGTGLSHQVGGGVPGAGPDLGQVVADRGDVADLAAGPDLLAVELHPQPPVPGEAVQQRRRQVLD